MGDVRAVAPRVHAHASADRAGNADGPLQAGQAGLDRLAGQGRQWNGAPGPHHVIVDGHGPEAGRVENHSDTAESGVRHQEVGPASHDQDRQPGLPHRGTDQDQVLLRDGRDEQGGSSAHPVGRQRSERSARDGPSAEGRQQLATRPGRLPHRRRRASPPRWSRVLPTGAARLRGRSEEAPRQGGQVARTERETQVTRSEDRDAAPARPRPGWAGSGRPRRGGRRRRQSAIKRPVTPGRLGSPAG